jgi:hypothetical protein
MLFDGDCAFRHWKYPGSFSQQPAFDIQVYREIQRSWVPLRNEQIRQEFGRK